MGNEAAVKLLLGWDNINVNLEDQDRRTPLSWAAGNGFEGVVKQLLPQENINLKDSYGRTVLYCAASKASKGVVKLLLAQPYIDVNLQDRN